MIGRHLCDRFRREGWAVRAMMRRTDEYPFAQSGIARFALRLPDEMDSAAFDGADVVVHAAHAVRGASAASLRRTNEAGGRHVITRAHDAGARVVFISTFAAATDTTSEYAESKRTVERMLDRERDLIVRPGFVLAADGGMVRRLWDAMMRFHVAPLFRGGAQVVQTIHVDDLCESLVHAITANLTGALNIAEPSGTPLRDLLRDMARASGTFCTQVPLPVTPVMALLRVAELLRMSMPITTDNLQGLLGLRHVDTSGDIARVHVRVRPAAESIAQLAPLVRSR